MKVIANIIAPLSLCMLFFACTKEITRIDDIAAYSDEKYFTASLKSLHFIIETSDIPRIDQSFNSTIKKYDLPTNATGCSDGTFWAASPYDAYDYRHVIMLTIKDENILSVDYNELYKDGIGKQEDSLYCSDMSASGTTPAIAYPVMENHLLKTQDVLQVDAVTGASYSLYRFRYAAILALANARLDAGYVPE